MRGTLKYNLSGYALLLIVFLAVILACVFKWNSPSSLSYIDGDARDYYSYLISAFVKHDLTHPSGSEWFILQTSGGAINVHPVGEAVLLLPFFLLAYLFSGLFGFPADGVSYPFQLGIAAAAITYAAIGLHYIRKTLQLHTVSEKVTAFVLILTFFGTNLLHYTLSEALMSHVYSFCLVSIFVFHSSKYALLRQPKNIITAGLILGLIVLVRPNNILVLLSIPMWFKSFGDFKSFLISTIKSKYFYMAVSAAAIIVFVQPLLWLIQSGSFFHHTYKADGFYWLHPQLVKMLFGFDGGFFIYVPLCLLFLFGIFTFRQAKWQLASALFLVLGLFYFFSSYWAYTYFDGLGIRVLVDYYALFSFFGAKLFAHFTTHKLVFSLLLAVAGVLSGISMIYCLQYHKHILQPAGMTFNKWKYIFLRTGSKYEDCLGGSYDLAPYSDKKIEPSLEKEYHAGQSFNYANQEYGVEVVFDSIGFSSNRIHLEIDVERTESFINSSKDAVIAVALDDKKHDMPPIYSSSRLNEIPSQDCCETKSYSYSGNIMGKFSKTARLVVFIWNRTKQPFLLNKLKVRVYNYNYQVN